MISHKTLILLGTAAVLFSSVKAQACEPCSKILNLSETSSLADLVIVGKSLTKNVPPAQEPGGPDEIEVWIIRVIAGKEERRTITVNSWDAMCPYGIVVDSTPHVMLLKRDKEKYDSVNWGCAEKSYKIEKETVSVDGKEMSIDAFAELVNKYRTK